MNLTQPDLHKDKREIQYKERKEMGKKSSQRRVYTKEFKVEAVALAENREKLISQIAKDLGLNENVLRRWMHLFQETAGSEVQAFPGHGRPRDKELARLKKENKALRNANEILKKAAVIFAQGEPQ
jgi:transposase-like protein